MTTRSTNSLGILQNDYLAALVLVFVGLIVVVKKMDTIVVELRTLNSNLNTFNNLNSLTN